MCEIQFFKVIDPAPLLVYLICSGDEGEGHALWGSAQL